jgi:hypothetical protein
MTPPFDAAKGDAADCSNWPLEDGTRFMGDPAEILGDGNTPGDCCLSGEGVAAIAPGRKLNTPPNPVPLGLDMDMGRPPMRLRAPAPVANGLGCMPCTVSEEANHRMSAHSRAAMALDECNKGTFSLGF